MFNNYKKRIAEEIDAKYKHQYYLQLKDELWEIKKTLGNLHILATPLVVCDRCGHLTTAHSCEFKNEVVSGYSHNLYYCKLCQTKQDGKI